jgi:hypothetical protein
LAARAYDGQADLLGATLSVVTRMPALIEKRDGVYWVENPVCSGENFADKWSDYPQRRRKFIQWQTAVARDLEDALHEQGGVRAVHERLEKAFGAEPVRKAAAAIGEQARGSRETGTLRMSSGGLLAVGGAGLAVREHRFYGGRTPA